MAKNRKTFDILPPEESVSNVTPVTQSNNVTQVSNTTQVTQPNNVTHVNDVTQVSNVTPITPAAQIEVQKKRVYVNITMDHYLFAKKKTGNALATLQDYFDALIEYDRNHNIIEYKEN